MTVNATRPGPVEGSAEAQVARIIDQAKAKGLQLTDAEAIAARHDQADVGGCAAGRDGRPPGL